MEIQWTDCMRFRAKARGFELVQIERILRYSLERYIDQATGRMVAVGRHNQRLIIVPYEIESGVIRPITVHDSTRLQIIARLQSGRFTHE